MTEVFKYNFPYTRNFRKEIVWEINDITLTLVHNPITNFLKIILNDTVIFENKIPPFPFIPDEKEFKITFDIFGNDVYVVMIKIYPKNVLVNSEGYNPKGLRPIYFDYDLYLFGEKIELNLI